MARDESLEPTYNLAGQPVHLPHGARELARTFASDMMDADRLLHLAAILSASNLSRGSIVVEIGAYQGLTSAFMATMLRQLGHLATILSIDPFQRAEADEQNPRGSYWQYLRTVQKYGVEATCLPLAAFSEDAAPAVPRNVAVLVVDRSHYYRAVKSDLALYGCKLVCGGSMFVDEYRTAYPGVGRAVNEFLESNSEFEVLLKRKFVIARRRPPSI